jgi:acyl-CoA reductase-like NAD-dependent aldehyde dehydrogenase
MNHIHTPRTVIQKTISPVDGKVYVERTLAGSEEINEKLRIARHAFTSWRGTNSRNGAT